MCFTFIFLLVHFGLENMLRIPTYGATWVLDVFTLLISCISSRNNPFKPILHQKTARPNLGKKPDVRQSLGMWKSFPGQCGSGGFGRKFRQKPKKHRIRNDQIDKTTGTESQTPSYIDAISLAPCTIGLIDWTWEKECNL